MRENVIQHLNKNGPGDPVDIAMAGGVHTPAVV